MAYSGLGEQRTMRSYLEWRRRARTVVTLTVGALTLVGLFGFALYRDAFKNDFVPQSNPAKVQVSFGLDREPVNRTFLLDLKPGKTSGTSSPGQEVTVRLSSDLRRHRDSAAEFPADQVTVGLDKLTATTVNLTVGVNPWAPERVQAGLYEGVLELRGPGISQDVPMSVWLRSRDNWRAAMALGLLLAGTLMGLLVKWITERLTPQAHQMRRLSALKDAIGYESDRETIPVRFRLRIRDLEGQIARQDYAGVEESFKELEKDKALLALLSAQMRILFGQLDQQVSFIDRAKPAEEHRLLLEGAVDGQYRAIQQLLITSQDAETEAEAALPGEAQQLTARFAAVLNLMSDFLTHSGDPLLAEALSEVRAGSLEPAIQKHRTWRQSPPAAEPPTAGSRPSSATDAVELRLRPRRPRKARQVAFMFQYSRAMAGLSSAVVVALVGLKLQYLDNQGFGGRMTDWLGLALWGVVVELSGVSVLEVVGRLGTSGPTAGRFESK